MGNFIFDNISTEKNEGRLLMAALTILTTSDFTFKNKIIKGATKTPEEICVLINELSHDMFYETSLCSVCGLEIEYPNHSVKKCNCGRLYHTYHTSKCNHVDYLDLINKK